MSKTATIAACVMMFMVACCNTRNAVRSTRESCSSYCGLLFDGAPNGAMSCDQLQEAEDVTLKIMDQDHCKDDPRMCKQAACRSFFGYQIVTEDADAVLWVQDNQLIGPFVGMTSPGPKVVTLARANDWRAGSIPHELVHVMQEGTPPAGWVESDTEKSNGVGHSGWTEHGVYKSIDDIRSGRK